jgi:hypothetical protein
VLRHVHVCARYGGVVLWHYAFVRHWFKINLTTDLAGQVVETGGDEPGGRLAFNCDAATPMRRHGAKHQRRGEAERGRSRLAGVRVPRVAGCC